MLHQKGGRWIASLPFAMTEEAMGGTTTKSTIAQKSQ
jgi:hypothetical protein